MVKLLSLSSTCTISSDSDDEPDHYGQVHPKETSQLIQEKLAQFAEELVERTVHPTLLNQEYLMAKEKCPELLTSQFELMFLRSEVFRVTDAVTRYLNYWKKRVEIFGDKKAFEPLTLDKALSEDGTALQIGYLRLLVGVTDPHGRSILFSDPSTQDRSKYTRLSLTRASWYVVHAALENENSQKYGVVVIGDPSRASFSQFDRKVSKIMLPCMQGAIPVRLSAYHVCKPPAFAALVLPILKLFMSERVKKRVAFHTGSNADVLKSLRKYGIDKSCVPVELGGDVRIDHISWMEKRRQQGL
jgi:hypothetical protein